MEGDASRRPRELAGVAVLTALAAVLLLAKLDSPYLWQDEAQTAVIARTILSHGVPLGHDGRNHFSQELGREYGEGGLWRWHTWLSFYAVAASFWLFGEGTASARLPSALFGLATVLLAYASGRVLWRERWSAFAGALLLALCVPFLLLARQCRYFGASAFFSLLGLFAYARLGAGRRAAWLLFAAVFLLFHSHYVYAATLLAALWLHALCFAREHVRTLLAVSAGALAANLPWIVWLSGVRPAGDRYLATVLDPEKWLHFVGEYIALLSVHVFPLWLLLAVPAIALLRRRRGEPAWSLDRADREHAALLGLFCAITVAGLAALSPLAFFRYLAPLVPPLLLLAGLLLGRLARRAPALAGVALVVFAASGPLRDHLYELTHDFDGPIEGIVTFLREHGSDADTVAISYGDMPLKFYTKMRVIGGLTGEDLAPARDADWIVPRHATNTEEDRRVRRALLDILARGGYRPHRLEVPDTTFENREDPRVHRYRTAGPAFPRVTIFERSP